jgi:hypothetical protein
MFIIMIMIVIMIMIIIVMNYDCRIRPAMMARLQVSWVAARTPSATCSAAIAERNAEFQRLIGDNTDTYFQTWSWI